MTAGRQWWFRRCLHDGDRKNTTVCSFDLRSPRTTAFEIYEWLYESLKLDEQDILMAQVDGPKRQVYIKFKEKGRMEVTVLTTRG